MQITGKITTVLPQKGGTTKKGGTWAAQQFVLETADNPKTSILLEVFGQKEIDGFAIREGETVTVTYNPNVHQFEDRYFGKNSVTAVERETPFPDNDQEPAL